MRLKLKASFKLCLTSQNGYAVVEARRAAAGVGLCQVLGQASPQVPLQGGSLAEISGGHQLVQRSRLLGNKGFVLLSSAARCPTPDGSWSWPRVLQPLSLGPRSIFGAEMKIKENDTTEETKNSQFCEGSRG